MSFKSRIRPTCVGSWLVLAFLPACTNVTGETQRPGLDFDFSNGAQGWTAGFADYPPGNESFYELASGYRGLPAPLNTRSGFFISGNNHSDDLFMYIKRRVDGFELNTNYQVSFVVEFATDVPTGCGGVGGSPGDSVFVKAGASSLEPTTFVDQLGWLRMNIDKGNQANSGANAIVIGNVANSTLCEQNIRRYEIKQLRTPGAVLVTTDGSGSAWLLVGTDSGFEAVTTLYYTRITAEFSKQ
jgi:hypothetical protein